MSRKEDEQRKQGEEDAKEDLELDEKDAGNVSGGTSPEPSFKSPTFK